MSQKSSPKGTVKCRFCGNLKYDWCEKRNDSPDKDYDRICTDYLPMTHGERIRKTDDYELAKLFAGFCKGQRECASCPMCKSGCPTTSDVYGWLEWMQAPAFEGPDMSVDDAILLIQNEYTKAAKNPAVKNPLAYVLYKVWRKVDGQ